MPDRDDAPTGLSDFTSSVEFWLRVDDETAPFRRTSLQGRFFESVEGATSSLKLINGPSRAEDSDGYERVFCETGPDGWVLSAERRSRGRGTRTLTLGVFSKFEHCAKYVLAAYVANSVREGVGTLSNVQAELSSAPISAGWATADAPEVAFAAFVDCVGSRIVCVRALSAVTHIASAGFAQINRWYADGVNVAAAQQQPTTSL